MAGTVPGVFCVSLNLPNSSTRQETKCCHLNCAALVTASQRAGKSSMSPPSQDVIRQDSDIHWCFINIEVMVHSRMFWCTYIHAMEFLNQHLACTLSQYTFVWCEHLKVRSCQLPSLQYLVINCNHQVINSSSEIIPLVKVDLGSSDQRLPNSIIPSLWTVPFSLWLRILLSYPHVRVRICGTLSLLPACFILLNVPQDPPNRFHKDRFHFSLGLNKTALCLLSYFFICLPAHECSDSFHFLAIMNNASRKRKIQVFTLTRWFRSLL